MSVSTVEIASDAYMVCLHHAFTTDSEEIMGLLIGQYNKDEDAESHTCVVQSAVTLKRSVKKKDRVEISPEMLIEAQQKAELMSSKTNCQLNVVGWYHSHPHITVWPSDVDLNTQARYQQMDDRFVGLIFSVFNDDKKTKTGSHHLTCFQALNGRLYNSSKFQRKAIPFTVVPSHSLSLNNQEALTSLIETLFDEQKEVFEESRTNLKKFPLVHMHNSSVRNVCDLSRYISGPLLMTLESEMDLMKSAKQHLDEESNSLEDILKQKGIAIDSERF